MKGNTIVIQALNEVLTGELTAINQYFLHSKMQKSQGYSKLAAHSYKESIEEMKHAQEVIDRILFLEGIPNVQRLDKINIGENVKEQMESDLALEITAIERLKNGIELCTAQRDHASRLLLEAILKDEEEHIDWIETQLALMSQIGMENYLAQQLHGGE